MATRKSLVIQFVRDAARNSRVNSAAAAGFRRLMAAEFKVAAGLPATSCRTGDRPAAPIAALEVWNERREARARSEWDILIQE